MLNDVGRDVLITFPWASVVFLMALAAPVSASEDRQSNLPCHVGTYRFAGSVEKGMSYSHRFDGLTFGLEPIEHGWSIDISQGSRHYLANMTGPSHGPGNPLYIEGWHFRNAANSGPNTGDVNEPQELRNIPVFPEMESLRRCNWTRQGWQRST